MDQGAKLPCKYNESPHGGKCWVVHEAQIEVLIGIIDTF